MTQFEKLPQRIQEIRENEPFVQELFRIATGKFTAREASVRLRGETYKFSLGSRPNEDHIKKFYRAGDFGFTDGIKSLGVLVSGSHNLEMQWKMYVAGTALIYDVFGQDSRIKAYTILGQLRVEETLVGIVLDDFGDISEIKDSVVPELEKLFLDTDSLCFRDDNDNIYAVDFDKALPTPAYTSKFYGFYRTLGEDAASFTISHKKIKF